MKFNAELQRKKSRKQRTKTVLRLYQKNNRLFCRNNRLWVNCLKGIFANFEGIMKINAELQRKESRKQIHKTVLR